MPIDHKGNEISSALWWSTGRRSCKSALNPPVVYSTDRSKAVVPVLILLFVALWFILRSDLFYVLPCVILLLCFSVLLALRLQCTSLGEKRANLSAFRTFVRFMLVWICRFPLFSGKGCGLWLWHSLDFSLTFCGLKHTKISRAFSENHKHILKQDWKTLQSFRGINSLSNCLFPSPLGSQRFPFRGGPFQKGIGVQESKEEIKNVVKYGGKSTNSIHLPWNV